MSVKTNAMRILEQNKVQYQAHSYQVKDGNIDGVTVAGKIGRPVESVYKTLVTRRGDHLYVFVIPAGKELDLKKAAKAAGEKKLELLYVKDLQKYTGYIRGGCSPLGMKKGYPTFIDQSAQSLDTIIVSAGKIGMQIELAPVDLAVVAGAKFAEVIKE